MTIIRGARVLSVGTMTEAGATPAPDARPAAVPRPPRSRSTPKQADLLTLADVNTTLRLALRSPREALRSQPAEKLVLAKDQAPPRPAPGSRTDLPQLLPQLFTPFRNPVAAAAASEAEAAPPAVAVIDGDKVVPGAH